MTVVPLRKYSETYGDLSDEDRPYADEAKEDGSWEERPLGKRGVKLVVTPSVGNEYITVLDYVSGKFGS